MIDRGLQRAIFLTFVVVIVARLASAVFDGWMGDTQDEMVTNQEALVSYQQGIAASQNAARNDAVVAENCRILMSRKICSRPKDFWEAGECLHMLNMSRCDQLPRVHLCAAVEELELCMDTFEDQKENGCNRLRRNASCDEKPAPEDRANLWRIRLDDGMWDGVE